MNTSSLSLKTTISDIRFIRQIAKFFLIMGDDVRPIVQKPIIDDFIGKQPIQHALDAGCGRGMYTRILLDRAVKVTALDYSSDSIDALRRRLGHLSQLSLHVGSADNLPFADAQFDVVTHCEVLEHIEDDRKVLSELHRVLQPGGRLVISVPVPPAPIDDKYHVREGYTFEQITTLLQEAGFEVLRHQYCMFNWSKRLIKFQAWWALRSKLPLPAVILLSIYWERYFGNRMSDSNLPYDIVLETRKCSSV
jgi:ubiquinone/menaquinone biosynthesis C-methylase UbiE